VRDCLFTAREVAAALMRVGEGMTYRATGRYVRRLANRLKPAWGTIPPHPSRDGSLVEDWVEVFAPVVFEPRRPTEWPEVLILDDLPFRVRSTVTAGGTIVAYRVFGALADHGRGVSSVIRLQAFPDKTPASWQGFLTGLTGSPSLIVCDAESGMLRGIELAFGSQPYNSPVVWLCHYHLKRALSKLLYRYKAHPVLAAALDRALSSPRDWQRFVRFSTRYRLRQLDRWLDQPDPTWWAGKGSRYDRIVWQLDEQLPWLPASTGALEAKLDWLREQLKQRRFALRNRERTNRMLSLTQLHLNGQDNELAYSHSIREAIAADGGKGAPRGLILDPSGYSSLWS
jgi:hypothetical protein